MKYGMKDAYAQIVVEVGNDEIVSVYGFRNNTAGAKALIMFDVDLGTFESAKDHAEQSGREMEISSLVMADHETLEVTYYSALFEDRYTASFRAGKRVS
jgi:hypothetical protein